MQLFPSQIGGNAAHMNRTYLAFEICVFRVNCFPLLSLKVNAKLCALTKLINVKILLLFLISHHKDLCVRSGPYV